MAASYYSKLIDKLGSHYGLEVSGLDASSFDSEFGRFCGGLFQFWFVLFLPVLHTSDATMDWLKGLFYRSYTYLGDIG